MGKTLSVCIKENDLDSFIQSVNEGAQVYCNHLIAAMRLECDEIFKYITANYGATTKRVELLNAMYSQIGILTEFPTSRLMKPLLTYISQVYYGGSRQFVFKRYEYKGFLWVLQVENSTQDSTLYNVNQLFITSQKKIADTLSTFENKRDFLKHYDFVLERTTQFENVQAKPQVTSTIDEKPESALDILKNVKAAIDLNVTDPSHMTVGEIIKSMRNLSMYEGSKMHDIILKNWLRYLQETILVRDREPYYMFVKKHELGNPDHYRKLSLSTTIEDEQLLVDWYNLMMAVTEFRKQEK